jgi:PHD/YefM family antitoxin component YafN of YafNO toxin-antitoxin module
MVRVTVTEFARNFGRYREEAQRAPVAITRHGQTTGYFLSPHEFAELERLRAYERRAHRIEELPDDLFRAIMNSRMDPRHDHLNKQFDE